MTSSCGRWGKSKGQRVFQRLKRKTGCKAGWELQDRSVLRAFFDAALLGLGALDAAARRQALVAQNAQGFDFGPLAVA